MPHAARLTQTEISAARRNSMDHDNSFRHLDAALATMTPAELQEFFRPSPPSLEKCEMHPTGSFPGRRDTTWSCPNFSGSTTDSGDTFRDLYEVFARIRTDTSRSASLGRAKVDTPADLRKFKRTNKEASQAPPLPLLAPSTLKGRFARKFKSLVSSLATRSASAPPPHGF